MAGKWAQAFYTSKAWQDLRMALIAKRGPKCQRCGNNYMFDTSQLIGHHIKELTPDTVNDPNIALNPDNIELICTHCHNEVHDRFGSHTQHVYIIYGSPCSGKTTLVNQLHVRGDLILDFDKIYAAISGCALYDKPQRIKLNAFRIRDLILDQVRTRYGHWHDAYIIGGYPHKGEREQLAERLRAELLYCQSTKEECMARAGQRGVYAGKWQDYIKNWWLEYEA